MRKNITVLASFCDACERQEGLLYKCANRCGKEFCYNCSTQHPETASVYSDSERWGSRHYETLRMLVYCRACDIELYESQTDSLHNKLYRLRSLQQAHEREFAEFSEAAKSLSAEIKVMRVERGLEFTRD